MDEVDKAIERLKLGSDMSLRYYGKPLMITYSGGKDSEVLADLAIKAKIPIEIVNSHTTADAPPTVYHIRNQFKKWENDGNAARRRYKSRYEAIVFFMHFALADCERIAVENPVGIMSTAYRKPDCIVQPYMFGDAHEKKTCFWLKGLPALQPTCTVEPPPRKKFNSGKSMPAWYAEAWRLPKNERAKLRSKTPIGIAKAMAEQWGGTI